MSRTLVVTRRALGPARWSLLAAALVVVGCPKKEAAPVAAAAAEAPALRPTRLTAPGPLTPPAWTLPTAATATLSNGVPVYLVVNDEVPLVNVTIGFRSGSPTDPKGKEGLAVATMDMLMKGAGKRDVDALARELKRLGTEMSTGASDDGASLSFSTLTRTLGPSLELAGSLLTEASFPKAEWALLAKQYGDNIAYRRQDPNAKANTVLDVVTYGGAYKGRQMSEASVAAITLADMKAWRKERLTADNAVVYVGGATTLDEVVPLLERALAGLPKSGKAPPSVTTPAAPTGRPLTLVDQPGAAQSIILATAYVGSPTEPGYADLEVANAAWGGMFTSRLNMNLREAKGYTYGARSSVSYDLAGVRFRLSAPVQADKTIPAMQEILAELAATGGDRPLSDAEIGAAKGSIVNSYPLPFENPGKLLGELSDVRRYGLGDDWIATWLDRVKAVDAASAQAAWQSRIASAPMRYVVVGDAATLREPLTALGFEVEERDADGVRLTR